MRIRAGLVAVALTAAVLGPGLAAPEAACAGGAPRAVLVVNTGSDVVRYCVALGERSVSGTDLIVLASQQHGLSYRFGYGGGAVCMLAGVGTSGDDCFEDYPDFWGYWRGDGSGGWTWSSSGAASTTVTDGDVEGWSWGSGNDGSTHPQPPATRYGDVCAAVERSQRDEGRAGGRDVKESERDPQPAQTPSRSEAPAPSSDAGGAGTRGDRRKDPKDDREPRAPGRAIARAPRAGTPPGPGSGAPHPTAASPESDSGPPPAGLAAAAMTALLASAGVLVRVRSTRAERD
ncbi:MAG: hypothetical protein ACRDJV_09320 [Actinomycetota bacterium]